jgi:hypothetical protein
MARMPIIAGIPSPSAIPRLSFPSMERPFEAGDGEDEEVGDCVVDIGAREDNAVAEGEVVAGKIVVAPEAEAD